MEPWRSKLIAGEEQAAWDLFVERYRRLIIATIKAHVGDRDDVMDVFSEACAALTADDFARLRKYSDQLPHSASVSTWLVTVVRNLTLDWVRRRDGRRRVVTPATLSPLHREIHRAMCADGLTAAEAFERIHRQTDPPLLFHQFLRETRETQRIAPCAEGARARFNAAVEDDASRDVSEPGEAAAAARLLAAAMEKHPADVRLAIELFVIERMAAADVARVVGWPDAKSVYNRVRRSLHSIREDLERQGLERSDL